MAHARLRSAAIALGALILTHLSYGQPPPAKPDAPPAPMAKGDRILAMDITVPEDDNYAAALQLAKSAGAQAVSLSFPWDAIETAPGAYGLKPNWLKTANEYYPTQHIAVGLVIAPIDTIHLKLPADVRAKALNDPAVIERFEKLLDYVFSQVPNVQLASVSLGNEVDSYLRRHPEQWAQYEELYAAGLARVHQLRPGVPVGVKGTFAGVMDTAKAQMKKLNRLSDAILVTYYPLNTDMTVQEPAVVGRDFAALAAAYPDKPIHLPEAGYPSSPACGSSEAKQAEFVRCLFNAWDAQAAHIKLVEFFWLTERSKAMTDNFAKYFGTTDRRFVGYLGSIGLRTWPGSGKDKPAFEVLKAEANVRGWR